VADSHTSERKILEDRLKVEQRHNLTHVHEHNLTLAHKGNSSKGLHKENSSSIPPPGCWVVHERSFCYLQTNLAGGYDPYDTKESAEYNCACDSTCNGVYFNMRQWDGGEAYKYYLCNGQPFVYEPYEYYQKVIEKGPTITCLYWSGNPYECETSYDPYPTPSPTRPPYYPTPAPTPGWGAQCGVWSSSPPAVDIWEPYVCTGGQHCTCEDAGCSGMCGLYCC
jgi:hypothetical protein